MDDYPGVPTNVTRRDLALIMARLRHWFDVAVMSIVIVVLIASVIVSLVRISQVGVVAWFEEAIEYGQGLMSHTAGCMTVDGVLVDDPNSNRECCPWCL